MKGRIESFTLNHKLETIKLSEEGILKAEISQKLDLSHQTFSQVVIAKKKFLKEIKSVTSVSTHMKRDQNNLIVNMEKVLVICMEDQTNHHIPLCQSIIQSKTLIIFISMKSDRGGKLQKKNWKIEEVSS